MFWKHCVRNTGRAGAPGLGSFLIAHWRSRDNLNLKLLNHAPMHRFFSQSIKRTAPAELVEGDTVLRVKRLC